MTVADRLAEIISMQLGIDRDRVTRDASFAGDLGADSLDAVELVMKCEDWFDISIPDEDVERLRTVGDAVTYLEKRLKEQASASANGPRVGAMPQKPQPAAPKPQPAPVVQAAPGPIGPVAAAEHFRWLPVAALVWAVLWTVPVAVSALSLLGVLPYGKLSYSFLQATTCACAMATWTIGCSVTAECQDRGMTEFEKSKKKAVYADASYTGAYQSAVLWLVGGFFVVLAGLAISLSVIQELAFNQKPFSHAVCGVLFLGGSGVFLSMWQLRIAQACGKAAGSWGHASVEERAKQVVRDLRVLFLEALGFPVIGLVMLLRLRGTLWLWVVALVFEVFFVYCLVRLTSLLRMTANALSGGAANGGKP